MSKQYSSGMNVSLFLRDNPRCAVETRDMKDGNVAVEIGTYPHTFTIYCNPKCLADLADKLSQAATIRQQAKDGTAEKGSKAAEKPAVRCPECAAVGEQTSDR